MRLITHNMLQCHKRSCKQHSHALQLEATQVESKETDYNPDFLMNFIHRLDWPVLRETAKLLNIGELPDEVPENTNNEDFLRNLHTILMETHLTEGNLKCGNCGRLYPIKGGIANMLLNEDEV